MSASGKGSDREPGQDRGEISPEERAAFRRRAEELDSRLGEVKARRTPASSGEQRARGAAMAQAMRIVADLVAGVGVGGFIGWALDRYLGTTPWLLIVFVILGFAAGLSNVIRAAKHMQAKAEPLQRSARPVPDDDD